MTQKLPTQPLEEGLENAFVSMVDNQYFSEALSFIRTCVYKVPHHSVLRMIIFKILMDKDCDTPVAMEARDYLNTILTIHQPSDGSRRLYYKRALTDENTSFQSLWAVFRHLVESSFCYHKILISEEDQISPVPYPNCDILIDFYIRVMSESYEYLSSEKAFKDDTEKSLVAQMFWHPEDFSLSASKENPKRFLEMINHIYAASAHIERIEVSRYLHQLLNLMVKCIVSMRYNLGGKPVPNDLSDSLICSHQCLLDVVKVLINTCRDAFVTHESMRRFLNNLSLTPLRFKVCEYKLYELIYSRQPSDRKFSSCTLSKIVNVYMFSNKACNSKRGRPKKRNPKNLCKEDEKNKRDKTPVVFSKASYSEDSIQKINWNLADAEGRTTLHSAVKNNKRDIANLILKNGGSICLNLKDKNGRKPAYYACDNEMKQTLKSYQTPDADKEIARPKPSYSDLDIRSFKNFREYAMFCHSTHFLLTYYSDLYNLYHLNKLIKNDTSSVQVYKHEENCCPHFTSCGENGVCSEDIEYLKVLPDIVNHFVKRTTECTKEKHLSIDLELLPLQLYVACLKC